MYPRYCMKTPTAPTLDFVLCWSSRPALQSKLEILLEKTNMATESSSSAGRGGRHSRRSATQRAPPPLSSTVAPHFRPLSAINQTDRVQILLFLLLHKSIASLFVCFFSKQLISRSILFVCLQLV